ncbi:MAG: helix-turn-helix domain-containing protein [Actinoplanes sp.]
MLTLMGKHLMGQAEIADRLGVSRQRVQQLIGKAGFPPPFDVLAMGKVWWIKDIDEWIQANRPALVDSEPSATDKPIGGRHGRTGPRKPAVMRSKQTPKN